MFFQKKVFYGFFALTSVFLFSACAQTAAVPSQNLPQNSSAILDQQQLLAGPVKKCSDMKEEGEKYTCFDAFLKDTVAQHSPEVAFQYLKAMYYTVPVVKNYCHPYTHTIGHAAVQKYQTLAEAYKHGDNFCWSGYYHGVMEQISKNIGSENLPKQMDQICKDVPGKEKYSFDYYNCVHGMGHGVMAITTNELFQSLKLCDHLTGRWEQESCYGGVFMENVIVDNLNHFTKYLKPKEPLYPCNAVETPYKQQCYLMQTSYMLKVTRYDFTKVFKLCEQADKDFVTTCYESLGRDASGSTVSNGVNARDLCLLGKDFTQQSHCVIGAVKDFVSYFHSDVQAKAFCNGFSDKKLVDVCLNTEVEYYKTF